MSHALSTSARAPSAIRTDAASNRTSIRRHLLGGLALVALLIGGVGGWAATTEISGAVVAPGQLVVESRVKKVQHPTGGVVGELLVKEGAAVKAGEIVVRLDDTQARASLAIVSKGLDELAARQARGEAELVGAEVVTFPANLLERIAEAEVGRLVTGERILFETRREGRRGKVAQLTERVSQLGQEIAGLEAQTAAKARETEWISRELEGVRELWQKNLIQFSRVTTLEREAARLEGERGHLVASTAQARGRIAETALQIIGVEQDLRTEVGKDLADLRAKWAELVERRITAHDQLKHVDIRAPQDGTVHQLTIHTVGGVVSPGGEPIMLIVPSDDVLAVEARIPPQSIDQVRLGQRVSLRFSAFDHATTPEIDGEVSLISADVTPDPRSGGSYYTMRVRIARTEMERLGSVRVVPGMPVEAFIHAGNRTVATYLLRPAADQMARAFRER